jgi:c-di-GMP-binding flagellar brake protein YcgR
VEPSFLAEPVEFTIIDLSVGGIGIVCENGMPVGTILSFKLPLDYIMYYVKCEVVYCIENSGKYRAGMRLVDREKGFIRHLKIFVARLTLQSMLGTGT